MNFAENNPNNYEAQWRIAELCFFMWENYMFAGNRKKAYKVSKIGLIYARRAVRLNPYGYDIKSNLMIAQNLLKLLYKCKKQHCVKIPILKILIHEYLPLE